MQTSAYLLDTAKEHIEGKISIDEVQIRIQSYYKQRADRTQTENDTEEADIVSARITKLLGEKAFQFSPVEWLTIHRRLFKDVFSHAGQTRQYNITKKEWVLKGDKRATAVFMIKYMKTFGFKVNNDAFEKNSWYFRNALVRANYNNLQKGVHATTKFLEMFFSNLLLGTEYELKN